MAKTVDELLEKNRPLKLEKALMSELFSDVRSGGGGIDPAKQEFYAQQAATGAGRQAQEIAQEIGAINTPGQLDARGVKAATALNKEAGEAGARARGGAFQLSEETRRGKEAQAYAMAAQRAQRRAESMNTIVRTAGTLAAAALTGGTSLAAQGLMGAARNALAGLRGTNTGPGITDFNLEEVIEPIEGPLTDY